MVAGCISLLRVPEKINVQFKIFHSLFYGSYKSCNRKKKSRNHEVVVSRDILILCGNKRFKTYISSDELVLEPAS